MSKLFYFKTNVLSQEELKLIKGGLVHCTAWCGDNSAVWQAYYTTYQGIANSINYWCGDAGGSYQCNGELQET